VAAHSGRRQRAIEAPSRIGPQAKTPQLQEAEFQMEQNGQRLQAALLALRAAHDMLSEIRRATTDGGQAEAIDNLCAKIAEVIHSHEPESDRVIGPT
jgi:hypothetical protein